LQRWADDGPQQGRRRDIPSTIGMHSLFDAVAAYLHALSPLEVVWIAIGFVGQFLFMMRFLWQWIQSERHKRSIIPLAFWYFSLAGGITLFAYALHRLDPVFITGQMLGIVVYTRNLLLIRRERRAGSPPA
jgi:lipid-A-disaccharide synthase-like uncharacterized protein